MHAILILLAFAAVIVAPATVAVCSGGDIDEAE
jgi:hypothetical protein